MKINTHKGLYQFKKLPFRVTSAPALWEKAMDVTISEIPRKACYLDDIIVTGATDQENLENLIKVIHRIKNV